MTLKFNFVKFQNLIDSIKFIILIITKPKVKGQNLDSLCKGPKKRLESV